MFPWIAAVFLFAFSFLMEGCSPSQTAAQASPTRLAQNQAGPSLTEVKSADSAYCKVEQTDPSHWTIRSEADGSTHELNTAELKERIEPRVADALREAGAQSPADASYELHVTCSPAGVSYSFNFSKGTPRSCVVADADFASLQVLANNEGKAGAACGGERPQALIAQASDENARAEAERTLRDRYPELVQNVSGDDGLLILLQLREDFRFREEEAKRRLEADPNLMSRLQTLDYDRLEAVSGASEPIAASTLPSGLQRIPTSAIAGLNQ